MAKSKKTPKQLLVEFGVPFHDRGEWLTVECAYHNDKHTTVEDCHGGINSDTGVFNCFSCGSKTNVINYLATLMSVPEGIIKVALDGIVGGTKNSQFSIETLAICNKELLGTPEKIARLEKQHGINIDSINKYHLGYYEATDRITIPIYSKSNVVIDVKLYKYDAKSYENKIIKTKGSGSALYPIIPATEETIYITEGEFKAILLNQKGFTAVSGTSGAGTWKPEWSDAFHNKHVILVFDIDEAGRTGAAKVCRKLLRYAKSVKNVVLSDVWDIPKGDITDYFVTLGRTAEDFKKLVDTTPYFKAVDSESSDLDDAAAIDVSLGDSSKAAYTNKNVSVTAVVAAKGMAPYVIPQKCKVVCAKDQEGCSVCRANVSTDYFITINNDDPTILDLVYASDKTQQEIFKRRGGVYGGCKAYKLQTVASANVESLQVASQIAVGHAAEQNIRRQAFFVGHGLSSNHAYKFTARATSIPDKHLATLLAYDKQNAVDDIDEFVLKHDLSVFRPKEWTLQSVEEKLNEVYTDLENNVTRIYERRDLHIFYDLIWHSVLYINFEGRNVKGWADGLVIGDSGQGKTEASSRLIEHYRCGERVDTKRASIAGLVGGLQKNGDQWFITWGTIPLNDRRLVVLEEVKGMPEPELARMTDMRSSGIAEIQKIERARTNARCRLVWVSNPRSDRKLSTYSYGVDAVKELIGSLEDIRRFDLVIATASGEVSMSVVNKRRDSSVPHTYTSDLCSHLVTWSWSLTASNIVIEDAAVDEIMAVASRLGKTYSSACPIVEPSDQRMKVLRLAAAIACRTYSTDDMGHMVIRKCHVEFIEQFLNRIYKSKGLGYYEYSVAQRGEEHIEDPEGVKAIMRDVPNARDTIKSIMEAELLRSEDIQNYTEYDFTRANEFIGLLARKNCLRRRKLGYRKTGPFIEILKELDREVIPNSTLREKHSKGELA